MSRSDLYMLLKAIEKDVEAVCLEFEDSEVCKRITSIIRAYMRKVEDKTISEFLRSYFY